MSLLLVAATPDELADYREAEAYILARQAARGTPPTDDLRVVTPAEAKELFPALTDVHGAVYYRSAARVDGRLMAAALLNGASATAAAEQAHALAAQVIGVPGAILPKS